MIRTFDADEIEAFRRLCETGLRGKFAKIKVLVRDHGACLGVGVETFDGRKHAVSVEPFGRADEVAAAYAIGYLMGWLHSRQDKH